VSEGVIGEGLGGAGQVRRS